MNPTENANGLSSTPVEPQTQSVVHVTWHITWHYQGCGALRNLGDPLLSEFLHGLDDQNLPGTSVTEYLKGQDH